MLDEPPISQQARSTVLQMLTGMCIARAIQVAAKHKIADLLKDTPKTIAELADISHTNEAALYMLLRALSEIGVFQETPPGTFTNTELSAILCEDSPGSLYYAALYWGSDWEWQTWGALDYSVTTGQQAFDHLFGMSIWEYLASHPEEERIFSGAMMNFSAPLYTAITRSYNFSTMRTIVDAGGGQGDLLIAILKANPNLHGILIDQAGVIHHAHNQICAANLQDRCTCLVGDFFHKLPDGADAYILKNVLHDWDDAQCLQILNVCRDAMTIQSKLLVIEDIQALQGQGSFTPFLSLQMLIQEKGRQRTEQEFRTLFTKAGFRILNLIPVASPTIIELCKEE